MDDLASYYSRISDSDDGNSSTDNIVKCTVQWATRFKRGTFRRCADLRDIKMSWHTPMLNRTSTSPESHLPVIPQCSHPLLRKEVAERCVMAKVVYYLRKAQVTWMDEYGARSTT